jgi:hypothetical protein
MKNGFFQRLYNISNVILLLGLAACSTMKVDSAKMQNIKSVAVVGFDLVQQQPVSKMDLLKIATHVKTSSGPGVGTRNDQEHVAEAYDMIVAKLAAEKGFQVVQRADLVSNPAYAALFKKRTEGLTSKSLVPDRYTLYSAPKVLDSFDVSTLTPEEKSNLQSALKVDAIIVVKSIVDLNFSGLWASLIGQATMSPAATSTVSMVDCRTGEEIWSDNHAVGEPVENSEKSFLGMAEDKKVNALAKQAVANSLDSAFQRIKAKAL